MGFKQFGIRVDEDLFEQVKNAASEQGVTMTHFVSSILAEAVGRSFKAPPAPGRPGKDKPKLTLEQVEILGHYNTFLGRCGKPAIDNYADIPEFFIRDISGKIR